MGKKPVAGVTEDTGETMPSDRLAQTDDRDAASSGDQGYERYEVTKAADSNSPSGTSDRIRRLAQGTSQGLVTVSGEKKPLDAEDFDHVTEIAEDCTTEPFRLVVEEASEDRGAVSSTQLHAVDKGIETQKGLTVIVSQEITQEPQSALVDARDAEDRAVTMPDVHTDSNAGSGGIAEITESLTLSRSRSAIHGVITISVIGLLVLTLIASVLLSPPENVPGIIVARSALAGAIPWLVGGALLIMMGSALQRKDA